MSKVFISYVREDSKIVDGLAAALRCNGVHVWLDRNDIQPGSRWKDAIRTAIRNGSYFLACFSRALHERSKSVMLEELTLATDELRQRPKDKIWFIPVLLDDCEVPEHRISEQESLRDLQTVALTPDWLTGFVRILSVIKPDAVTERSISASTVVSSMEGAIVEFGKAIKTIHTKWMFGEGGFIDSRPPVRALFIEIIEEATSSLKAEFSSIQSLSVRRGCEETQKRIAYLSEVIAGIQSHAMKLSNVFKDDKKLISDLAFSGVLFLLRATQDIAGESFLSKIR